MRMLLMPLGQALVYGLLTLPRTVGSPGLLLYFLIGGFLFFVRWAVRYVLQTSGFTHAEVILMALLDVALLSSPIYLMFFRSRAGRATGLIDGIVLGAFLGIGYGLNYALHLSEPLGESSLLTWTFGSVTSGYATVVPGSGRQVSWSGYAVWGALVGFGMAVARTLRPGIRPAIRWLAPALIALIVFLEIAVFMFFETGLIEPQTVWRSLSAAFHWMDSSGRQTRWLLVGCYLFSLGLGEHLFRSLNPSLGRFFLKSEPRMPTFLSELFGRVLALRTSVIAYTTVSGFFRCRRRLVAVLSQSHSPEDVLFAEDQVAERLVRAETALAEGTVVMDDNRLSVGQTVRKFAGGLVLTLVFASAYMASVALLGMLITSGLKNDPIGYIYATILVTALAYVVAYFREPITSRILSSVRPAKREGPSHKLP